MVKLLAKLLMWPFWRRQQAAMAMRASVGHDEFISRWTSGSARKVASTLWHELRNIAVVDDFRPLPEDDLRKMYGLAEEDLDEDLILRILDLEEIPKPDSSDVSRFGPVNLVYQVVDFVEMARKRAMHAAPAR